MSDIVYTRGVSSKAIADSSLVDEVYYNENTKELYVDLDTAVYKYSNVPPQVVADFEAADSAGSFYGQHIKRVFGPGENLGSWQFLEYEQESVIQPQNVTVAEGESDTVALANAGVDYISVGDATPLNSFSLRPFVDTSKVEGVEREYVINFEVDGLMGRKTHTLKSTSVDEAVQSVLDLGKMLDLNFIVREVTIRFE